MHMRSSARWGALFARPTGVALLGTAVLTGCGTPDSPPTPAYSPHDSALVAGAYGNPLDPVVYPDEVQQGAIAAAGEGLVTQCMADRGFDYTQHQVFIQYQSPSEAQYVFGPTDPEAAAVNGMRSALWIAAVTGGGDAGGTAPTEGYLEALFGDTSAQEVRDGTGLVIASYDPTSCAGIAKDRVTPHWAEQEYQLDIAYQILLDAGEAAASDPAVVEADAAWSRCMADRGFTYDGLQAAMSSPEFTQTDLPTAHEIEVAVATAECQQSSGLLRARSLARARYTSERLAEHPGLVTEWLALQQDALDAVGSSGAAG